MNNNEVLNIFKSRHSCRSFTNEVVKEEDLKTIVECGYCSPSGHNRQASHIFTFKKGEENYEKLTNICKNALNRDCFYNADVIILETIDSNGFTKMQDGSAAIENMLLAINLLNYGGCWINAPYTVYSQDNKAFKEIGIDETYLVVGGIAMGRKAQ